MYLLRIPQDLCFNNKDFTSIIDIIAFNLYTNKGKGTSGNATHKVWCITIHWALIATLALYHCLIQTHLQIFLTKFTTQLFIKQQI